MEKSLCTREEMIKVEDMGSFFRIPADNRGLNYSSYFSEGKKELSNINDYNSHNTEQKNIEGIKELLLKLDFIKEALLK
jgi:UDP-N-acetylglucosamine 4,6-dehydratase